jgi:peptidoglycan/xylan/chitin deacetylase (PgdA/CDA1 family)
MAALARLSGLIARTVPVLPRQIVEGRVVASITFDDFPKSAWTNGGSILAEFGVRATYYTAGSFCNRTVDGIEYYNHSDLEGLRNHGHEIACHGFGHRPTTLLSDAELSEDMARNQAFLAPFLDGETACSFAFPFGEVNLRTKRFYSTRFSSARGVHPALNQARADMSLLSAISLEERCWRPAFIADAIARTKEQGGLLVFYTHDISNEPTEYGSKPSVLKNVLQWLAAAKIPVMPIGEAVIHATAP